MSERPRARDREGKLLFTVGAFAVVFDERGDLLLGRRRDRGFWTLPGGGVEEDETPWQAVVRETREETGIEVEVIRLATLGWKRTSSDIVFVFECRITGGQLTTSEETSEVAFFPRSELPKLLPQRIIDRVDGLAAGDGVRLVETL